ncbi:MAG: sensor histidine kinase [Solirubrobacteraceae bacterium]
MSLRTRLLVGLLGLSLAGVLAVGGGTYLALRSFLFDRVDQQLMSARRSVQRALSGPDALAGGVIGASVLRNLAPPDTFLELRDHANHVEALARAGPPDEASPAPRLAAVFDPPTASASLAPSTAGVLRFDAGAVSGPGRYRVQVSSLPDDRGVLVVAVPLEDVTETLGRLVDVELVIAAVVLALLASGAFWLLRAGLLPLERIAETAAGIADGDLDVRVTPADTRSEIGRLGLALNGMLERLEEAFARRDRSEAQLRRFVSSASHELRTPLTSIRGYAALFRRGAQDNPEDLAKSIARIESEATRMSVLIDDLLLLARLDEQRPLERHQVDLRRIALDAAQDARARDPDRPITVHERGPVIVVGDEQRLRQVATNLLANAQIHTPPGTPVHVELLPCGDQAMLAVTDAGPGIDPAQAPHIFERFYRGTPVGTEDNAPRTAGAGLGLAIVAAIMDSHQGTATVRSQPGKGARFEITLPVAAAATSPTEAVVPASNAIAASASTGP